VADWTSIEQKLSAAVCLRICGVTFLADAGTLSTPVKNIARGHRVLGGSARSDYEQRGAVIFPSLEIPVDPDNCPFGEERDSLLAALAFDFCLTFLKINAVTVKRECLADTESSAKQELNERSKPKARKIYFPSSGSQRNGRNKIFDFSRGQV